MSRPLPVQVENSPLQCPACKYPLTPISGQSTKVLCPRCNTWLDIDPNCSGSCLSCHKSAAGPQTPCVETFLENSDQKCSDLDEFRVRNKSKNQSKNETLPEKLRFLAAKARRFLSS